MYTKNIKMVKKKVLSTIKTSIAKPVVNKKKQLSKISVKTKVAPEVKGKSKAVPYYMITPAKRS